LAIDVYFRPSFLDGPGIRYRRPVDGLVAYLCFRPGEPELFCIEYGPGVHIVESFYLFQRNGLGIFKCGDEEH